MAAGIVAEIVLELDGVVEAEALTQGLLQEFEGAPAEQVRADVEEFLARLRELGIVE